MNPTNLLRITSGLTLFHAMLHTIGAVFSKAQPGAMEATLAIMKANEFQLMGNTRTYWNLYLGLNLFVTVALTAEAIVFWQLGELAKSEAYRLRPILVTFLLAYCCYAVVAFTCFFIPPAAFELLIAATLAWTIAKSVKS